jgi:hypothetical protein
MSLAALLDHHRHLIHSSSYLLIYSAGFPYIGAPRRFTRGSLNHKVNTTSCLPTPPSTGVWTATTQTTSFRYFTSPSMHILPPSSSSHLLHHTAAGVICSKSSCDTCFLNVGAPSSAFSTAASLHQIPPTPLPKAPTTPASSTSVHPFCVFYRRCVITSNPVFVVLVINPPITTQK